MEQEKNWLELISETAAYITEKVGEMPKTAIILGTGLGELVNMSTSTKTLASGTTCRRYGKL